MSTLTENKKMKEWIVDLTTGIFSYFDKKIIKVEKNEKIRQLKLAYKYNFVSYDGVPEGGWEPIISEIKKEALAEIVEEIELDMDFSEKCPLQFVELVCGEVLIDPDTFEPSISFYVLVNDPIFKPNPNKHIVGII